MPKNSLRPAINSGVPSETPEEADETDPIQEAVSNAAESEVAHLGETPSSDFARENTPVEQEESPAQVDVSAKPQEHEAADGVSYVPIAMPQLQNAPSVSKPPSSMHSLGTLSECLSSKPDSKTEPSPITANTYSLVRTPVLGLLLVFCMLHRVIVCRQYALSIVSVFCLMISAGVQALDENAMFLSSFLSYDMPHEEMADFIRPLPRCKGLVELCRAQPAAGRTFARVFDAYHLAPAATSIPEITQHFQEFCVNVMNALSVAGMCHCSSLFMKLLSHFNYHLVYSAVLGRPRLCTCALPLVWRYSYWI